MGHLSIGDIMGKIRVLHYDGSTYQLAHTILNPNDSIIQNRICDDNMIIALMVTN